MLAKNRNVDLRWRNLQPGGQQTAEPRRVEDRAETDLISIIERTAIMAGEPVAEGEIEATFSDEIWKSPARRGQDVP